MPTRGASACISPAARWANAINSGDWSRTTTFCCCSMPITRKCHSPCRARSRRVRGMWASTPASRRCRCRASGSRARAVPFAHARWCCSRRKIPCMNVPSPRPRRRPRNDAMPETETLDRLCTAYGIAIEYEDFWGELRTVSDESKRALLSAMDVGVATSAQMQEALRRHEVSAWQRTLPPVHVAAEQQAIAFAITLPAMHIASSLTWRLTQENGEQHAGEFNSAQLERREERDIDGERRLRGFCTLPVQPPPGYHDLELSDGALAEPQRMRLIVTPARCYLPPALQDSARVWGQGVQLYRLRSQRIWCLGVFFVLLFLVV